MLEDRAAVHTPCVLGLYLHSFLELDHERELGEDGQVSLFRHGQLWRLHPHCTQHTAATSTPLLQSNSYLKWFDCELQQS